MSFYEVVRPETTIEDIKTECEYSGQTTFAVVSLDNTYQGYITVGDFNRFPHERTAHDVLNRVGRLSRDVYVFTDTPTDAAKKKLRQKKMDFMPVIDFSRQFIGTIDRDST